MAATPDRADGMNHVPGWQAITFGDPGIAGLAAAQPAAFFFQLRTGRAVYRSIDPTAAEQGGVGRVDDGVHAQGGNVGNNDFEPRVADQPCRPAHATVETGTPLSVKSCCNSPAWNISRTISQPP